MSDPDLATAVIDMRRALPEPAASAAHFGRDPEDGIRLSVPDDNQFWLLLQPTGLLGAGDGADAADSGAADSAGAEGAAAEEVHWQLTEVMSRGELLPVRSQVLASGSADSVLSEVDGQYRRLLLERRNAACGTPTR